MEKKTRKKSAILPILVILFIVIIVGIIVITKNLVDKKEKEEKQKIENSANEFLKEYEKEVEQQKVNSAKEFINEFKEVEKSNTNNTLKSNTSKTYKGFKVVGTISIPKANIKNPILDGISQEKLDTSVCLEKGKLNNNGNSIIAGKNYNNGLMFSNLKNLSVGDMISIIDEKGTSINYSVYKCYEVDSGDKSYLDRNVENKKELTLYTNNNDKTVVVLAEEK